MTVTLGEASCSVKAGKALVVGCMRGRKPVGRIVARCRSREGGCAAQMSALGWVCRSTPSHL